MLRPVYKIGNIPSQYKKISKILPPTFEINKIKSLLSKIKKD